jgi:acyl-CoA synthetase (AMP-forming)/AMP-acid ligase II
MNQPFNISELFFEAAALYPDHIAIIDGEKQITYRELQQQVNETTRYFMSKGIKKGDRVLIFVPMSIDLYRIVLALFRTGATAVFLDEWVTKKRMEVCCEIADCKGFIGVTKAQILRVFSKALRQIPIVLKLKPQLIKPIFDTFEPTQPNDTALITFTTGSTGTPKAAKRTHGFLKEQFSALKEKINPQPTDVDMSLLPIVLLINLGVGATSLIANFKASKPQRFDPSKLCAQAKQYHVNRMTASPFFIKLLSQHLIHYGKKLPLVKQVFTGGAPVFPNEAELYLKAFDHADVQIVYGSTEAEPISSINAGTLVESGKTKLLKGLLVGKPDHKAEVKIIPITEKNIDVSSEAELQLCPANTVGEIIVAGPHVLTAYFNNEEALKKNKIFIQQKVYHRTGDSGYLDENGNLYLTGRCATVFEIENETIYPFLYENYFQMIEGVTIGTVCFHHSEVIAVLELHDASQKKNAELRIRQLPVWFDKITFLKKIPRDPRHNSKIDYEKLKTLLNC